jgi:tetratricopeptide (TPR) repeat protein
MWKAMSFYDRASNPQAIVGALELFVAERAADPVAPDALLRLGRTYESMSQVAKAISAYERLQGAYAKSPAAAQAAIPLAMLYIGQGPGKFSSAETVLVAIADGKPEGDDYKRAVFELGMLYHRMNRLDKALPRLELFAQKFTGDPRAAEATFLAAECYRMTAQEIEVQLAGATVNAADDKSGAAALAKSAETKKSRLVNASRLYEQATQLYVAAPQPPGHGPLAATRGSEGRQSKLAALRRADCDYELRRFADAVGRYKAVVSKYPNDPVALAASVQIVNCYTAMNRLDEARAASEQARRLLETMPQAALEPGGDVKTNMTSGDDAATGASSVMSRTYFEQWLKWTGTPAASTY